MAIPTNLERLSYDSTDGCVAAGQHQEVISGLGATRTLLASESGALVLFDKADGIIITLPAPAIGMKFDFLVTVTGTSNAYSIDTDAATTFIGGGIQGNSTTAGGADSFPATIASTVSCDLDSAETGWLIGGYISIVCLSATTWGISGQTSGSGTLATPFA